MTLPNAQISRICRGLSLLLHSGIGVADGAFLLAQEEQAPLQTLLQTLGESMDGGLSLSEAMDASGAFPRHVWGMAAIGEETGRLEESLKALAEFYEERSRTTRQIRSAVAYPAMVLVLMLLVVGVLLVKVLPVFDRVYASLGSQLTGAAAALLYAGQLLESALPVLFGALLVLVGMAAVLWLCPGLRERLVRSWQRRYGDRGLARKFNNARFARAMAMGLASGLTLEHCMTLAQALLQEVPGAARRCAHCAQAMEEGASFSSAMEAASLLPPAQCRMLGIGLRGGNADQVMDKIARDVEEDAWETLYKAVSGIEPAMVLISSLLVGLILLSVMLPLVDILSVLG